MAHTHRQTDSQTDGRTWRLYDQLGQEGNLHMFLDILECRIEKKKNCLVKTILKMWSQKSTK